MDDIVDHYTAVIQLLAGLYFAFVFTTAYDKSLSFLLPFVRYASPSKIFFSNINERFQEKFLQFSQKIILYKSSSGRYDIKGKIQHIFSGFVERILRFFMRPPDIISMIFDLILFVLIPGFLLKNLNFRLPFAIYCSGVFFNFITSYFLKQYKESSAKKNKLSVEQVTKPQRGLFDYIRIKKLTDIFASKIRISVFVHIACFFYGMFFLLSLMITKYNLAKYEHKLDRISIFDKVYKSTIPEIENILSSITYYLLSIRLPLESHNFLLIISVVVFLFPLIFLPISFIGHLILSVSKSLIKMTVSSFFFLVIITLSTFFLYFVAFIHAIGFKVIIYFLILKSYIYYFFPGNSRDDDY